MEAEVYALNKRARHTGDEKDQNYLDEMARLKTKITELQDKQAYYENLVREAQESRDAAQQPASEAAPSAASSPETPSAAEGEEGDYEEAMDMLLEELQENLSTYDQISSQFSKARV